jgi:response regulator RpfG family c-di-GMP phosphodiesterase
VVRSLDDPEKKKIPIIALTANVMKTDLEKYLKAGINDFILKPFKEAELYQKIRELLPANENGQSKTAVQFQFEDFKRFSAGDDQALLPILEAFHSNLQQNLQLLVESSEKQDLKSVAELAHKMISSFGHVHANKPVNILRQLETKIRTNQSDMNLKATVAEIQQLSHPILEELEKEIKGLRG